MDDAEIHRQFDQFANRDVQAGELPNWLNVRGNVAWYVFQGPYAKLGDTWTLFARKVRGKGLKVHGPPGDVYVCDPTWHEDDGGAKLTTILWFPLRK